MEEIFGRKLGPDFIRQDAFRFGALLGKLKELNCSTVQDWHYNGEIKQYHIDVFEENSEIDSYMLEWLIKKLNVINSNIVETPLCSAHND